MTAKVGRKATFSYRRTIDPSVAAICAARAMFP
jgi:hypothetical protein